MQSKREVEYMSKVKAILAEMTDSVSIIEELIDLDHPSDEDSTYNTIAITNMLSELDTPSFEDFVEGTDAEELCDESVQMVRQSLKDIESGNFYSHQYSVELAYSKILGEDYTYKLVRKKVDARTFKEAIEEKTRIRNEAPRNHPQYEDYTLEDDRLKSAILNKENTLIYESSVAVPDK